MVCVLNANLLMGKWAAAASDAAKAYGTSAPYSVADVSQPTFYNAQIMHGYGVS